MEDETESSASGIEDIIPGENQMVARRVTQELTHGGDIVDDVAAILYAAEKGMPDVAEFKHDFLCAYCVTFESAMEIVKSGPIELLTTFDILATITEYPAWKKMEAGEAQKDGCYCRDGDACYPDGAGYERCIPSGIIWSRWDIGKYISSHAGYVFEYNPGDSEISPII